MSDTGSQSQAIKNQHRRQLRERKQRKLYSEEWALGDDDSEGVRGFSVAEKLESTKFAHIGMVREIQGNDLNVGFLQQYGFNIPLLIREKTGLGIRVPSPDFTINDVRLCVGSRRILDVMDVNTQKNLQMTMKEWQQYYEEPEKEKLLNVISLEFSHTKMDNFIQSPEIVRHIDWVDVVWPKQLKDAQTEGTNSIGHMKYPKVQKYCLMSVKNCYTDFHIDFGGTSVWYHILKGSKVFWLIPPTEKNLQLYEKWCLSGKQSDVFFGDTVEKCARVYLTAGNTFFIPTGWIHAVYTPTDSIVFGGNFLHSFGIVKQLKTAQVEDATKVPQKFRYPFFTEMLWYVLAKYVYTLLGRSHLENQASKSEDEIIKQPHIHLTHYELFGLKEIVMYLYDLPSNKKCVPDLIKDPVALIKDVRTLVERHCKDRPEMAITGFSVLQPEARDVEYKIYDRVALKAIIKQETEDGTYVQHQELKNYAYKPEEVNCIITGSGNNSNSTGNSNTCSNNSSNDSGTTSGAVEEPLLDITENKSSSTFNPAPLNEDANFVQPTTITGTTFLKTKALRKLHNFSGIIVDGAGNVICDLNATGNADKNCEIVSAPAGNIQNNLTVASTTNSSNSNNITMASNNINNTTSNGQPRRRRTRCKICEACQRSDCGECSFCLDMVKFGGPGRAKQTCMMRQCLSPMLPVTAQCVYCHLDGWRQTPVSPQAKQLASLDGPSSLMECSVCYEIAHPDCSQKLAQSPKGGIVNEDLPNSWECPSCCKLGKNNDYKPRHFRARQKSSEVRRISLSNDASTILENNKNAHVDSNTLVNHISNSSLSVYHQENATSGESELDMFTKDSTKSSVVIKTELYSNNNSSWSSSLVKYQQTSIDDSSNEHYSSMTKRRKSDENSVSSSLQDSMDNSEINPNVPRKRNLARIQLAQQIISSSTRVLKKPQYVVRPGPLPALLSSANPILDPTIVKLIFGYLSPETLVTCSAVCKVWSNVSVDPDLWKRMNCTEHKMTASLLTAIVRRQPEHLILDWTQIAKKQLAWTIARLPALKNLSLQSVPIQTVFALHTCQCPPLQVLDISFVRGLNDSAIREILSPPKDSRPGLTDSKSRLRNLKTLKIAGTDISDIALRYITQGLPSLIHLDLSSCQRVTDAGIAQIGTCSSAIGTLVELNISGCRLITELTLDYLSKCEQLILLDLRHVPLVTTQSVIKFAAESKHNLQVKDIKLVVPRETELDLDF